MERPGKDHTTIAKLVLSGAELDVGEYDSDRSSEPSVFIQTEDNAEPIYIKVAEAQLLAAALKAAIDHISRGD